MYFCLIDSVNVRRQSSNESVDNSEISNLINEISNMIGNGEVDIEGSEPEDGNDDVNTGSQATPVTSTQEPASGDINYNQGTPLTTIHQATYKAYHKPAFTTSYHQPAISTAYYQPAVTATYHHSPAPFHFTHFPAALPTGFGYQSIPYGYKMVEPVPTATHVKYQNGDAKPAAPASKTVTKKNHVVITQVELIIAKFSLFLSVTEKSQRTHRS